MARTSLGPQDFGNLSHRGLAKAPGKEANGVINLEISFRPSIKLVC